MIQNEDLLYAINHDIIDKDSMLHKINMNKRERALNMHEKTTYRIYPPTKSSKRWRTYVYDSNYPNNRREIAKTDYDKFLDCLVDEYIDKSIVAANRITLSDVFKQWINWELSDTNLDLRTIRRHEQYYNRYYANSSIINIPLKQLTGDSLESWCNTTISTFNLTRHEWNNLLVVLNGCIKLAIKKRYMTINPKDNLEITSRFSPKKKKPAIKQIYLENEQQELEKECWSEYECNHCIEPLAILLNFQLGCRLGELLGFKWSDIEQSSIHVQRQFKRCNKRLDGGRWADYYGIVEYTKTGRTGSDESNRYLYLTPKALELLALIKQHNVDSAYIFGLDTGFITTQRAITCRLEKYCNHMGIEPKRSHSIRRTVGSKLSACGYSPDGIRQWLGHSDLATTYSYLFNPYVEDKNRVIIGTALN